MACDLGGSVTVYLNEYGSVVLQILQTTWVTEDFTAETRRTQRV
jgi:hypothetical protein